MIRVPLFAQKSPSIISHPTTLLDWKFFQEQASEKEKIKTWTSGSIHHLWNPYKWDQVEVWNSPYALVWCSYISTQWASTSVLVVVCHLYTFFLLGMQYCFKWLPKSNSKWLSKSNSKWLLKSFRILTNSKQFCSHKTHSKRQQAIVCTHFTQSIHCFLLTFIRIFLSGNIFVLLLRLASV